MCIGRDRRDGKLCWSARRDLSLATAAASATLAAMSTTPTAPAAAAPRATSSVMVAALAAVYVIWGSTYLAMRIAIETLPPMGMGAVRFVLAGAILLVVHRLRGGAAPTARQWLRAVPVGALLCVGGNGLVAIAETEVSSGIAALVCATMPLWMAALATLTGERPSGREWLGIGVGLAGVAVLVGGAELSATPTAALILCGSPLAWAMGSVLARRLPLAPGLAGAGSQMLVGGLCLFVAAALHGEQVPAHASARSLGALLYLLVLGSLVGFTAYAWLLQHARPAVATSYAFVNPVLAVILGVALAGEPLTRPTVIAAPLVIVAVLLVVGGRRAPAKG